MNTVILNVKYSDAQEKIINMAQRTETYKLFQEFLNSDNVVKIGRNAFKEQCSQYVPTFTRKTLYAYFKNHYC
jgi:hypothetical protein